VEIMSPGYTAYRDGGEATIPAQYQKHGPVPVLMPERFGKVDTTPARKGMKKKTGNGLFP